MKKIKILILSLMLVAFVPFIQAEAAATPSLQLTINTGDQVIVTVTNADPNANVEFFYDSTNASGIQEASIGTTNSSGGFWTSISTGLYNISPNISVYVTVDGASSASEVWPYSSSSSNNGTISLSQSSVVLAVNQSTNVTVNNSSGNGLYVSNNSNPSVANTSINGSQLDISAINTGSTVITVCAGSSSDCTTAYVTVQNSSSGNPIVFNQNNVTVAQGETNTVTVSGGTGIYEILNNSNSSIVQSSINGSTISLYGEASSGSDSITICSTDQSSCGVLSVSIGNESSTGISFSQTNPIIPLDQTTVINVTGGNGSFYISSNSNPSVVSPSLSGSSLTLFANESGSSSITICSSTGTCGTEVVTVGSSGNGGSISLSQTSLNVLAGQAVSITISGGSEPYSIVGGSSNIAATSLNGATLTVTGIENGSDSIDVCSAGGGCVPLSIVVNSNGSSVSTQTSPNAITLAPTIAVGQTLTMTLSGQTGSYYVSSDPGNPYTATISGSTLTLTGVSTGSFSINLCSSNSVCIPLSVTVTAPGTTSTITTSSGTTVGDGFKFENPLALGSTGNDVTELQKRLAVEGVYTGPITGYYGSLTVAAVERYQSDHGIDALGNVGPATRASLNG